ncbi:hypothetical protein PMPD1_0474 [Paramixta manurensis]|uniref:Uncharacterized protein n=1 Tax=Paramixta manurensis TaxID=2740817 RepID=A0A6M8U9E1_9GAMM|nr:hypothetical protein PMPD1_0474 [Erwiniaceae bacterium PD-1]
MNVLTLNDVKMVSGAGKDNGLAMKHVASLPKMTLPIREGEVKLEWAPMEEYIPLFRNLLPF